MGHGNALGCPAQDCLRPLDPSWKIRRRHHPRIRSRRSWRLAADGPPRPNSNNSSYQHPSRPAGRAQTWQTQRRNAHAPAPSRTAKTRALPHRGPTHRRTPRRCSRRLLLRCVCASAPSFILLIPPCTFCFYLSRLTRPQPPARSRPRTSWNYMYTADAPSSVQC